MGKIEEKLKEINTELDAAADAGLQKAQRGKFTGVGLLLLILLALIGLGWLVTR